MVGTQWNRLDSRAIVPGETMKASKDVLSATPPTFSQSASAFALGVYSPGIEKTPAKRTDSEDEGDGGDVDDEAGIDDGLDSVLRPLPLFYVSPVVAAERAGSCPPITPGWYLTAHPGQNFEVRVSPTAGAASVEQTCPTADTIIASVHVDGVDSNPGGYAFRKAVLACEARFRGFTESVSRSPQGGLCVLRRFAFRKADLIEGPSKGSGQVFSAASDFSGTIRLTLESAQTSGLRTSSEERQYGAKKADPVNEREALKKGNSLGVDRMGKKITVSSSSFHYAVRDRKNISEAGIVVHVRERFWMESRRLVDATGSPCTQAMAAEMAKSAMNPIKRGTVDLDGPTSKRRKQESQVKLESIDIVDLT
jgi:hypothetical protein